MLLEHASIEVLLINVGIRDFLVLIFSVAGGLEEDRGFFGTYFGVTNQL
jgi:hypothetical protein